MYGIKIIHPAKTVRRKVMVARNSKNSNDARTERGGNSLVTLAVGNPDRRAIPKFVDSGGHWCGNLGGCYLFRH